MPGAAFSVDSEPQTIVLTDSDWNNSLLCTYQITEDTIFDLTAVTPQSASTQSFVSVAATNLGINTAAKMKFADITQMNVLDNNSTEFTTAQTGWQPFFTRSQAYTVRFDANGGSGSTDTEKPDSGSTDTEKPDSGSTDSGTADDDKTDNGTIDNEQLGEQGNADEDQDPPQTGDAGNVKFLIALTAFAALIGTALLNRKKYNK